MHSRLNDFRFFGIYGSFGFEGLARTCNTDSSNRFLQYIQLIYYMKFHHLTAEVENLYRGVLKMGVYNHVISLIEISKMRQYTSAFKGLWMKNLIWRKIENQKYILFLFWRNWSFHGQRLKRASPTLIFSTWNGPPPQAWAIYSR